MSQAASSLRKTLAGLGVGCLVLAGFMLHVQDSGTLAQVQLLSQRLDKADRDRLEALAAEEALKTLQPLVALADGRRSEFVAGVQQAADDPKLRAWAASLAPKAKKGQKEVNPKLALQAASQMLWSSAVLVDKAGRVEASWVNPSAASLQGAGLSTDQGADFSKDPIFKELSNPNSAPGIPSYTFVKGTVMASAPAPMPVPAPAKGKDGKPLPAAKAAAPAKPAGPTAKNVAIMVVGCGIEGANGNFGGLLLVRGNAQDILLGHDFNGFGAVLQNSPKAAGMLLRGNGDELYHSAKDPFTENLGVISPDYKNILTSTLRNASGHATVASYDGVSGVLIWQRVGAAPDNAGPEAVLSAATFIPEAGLKAGAATTFDQPQPFFKRPLVLLLLLLTVGLPFAIGFLRLPAALLPYGRSAAQAKRVEEYGPVPELMLSEESEDDARALNNALGILSRRAAQAEDRVRELDSALRRVEDQAGRDATQSAMELSQLRDKVGQADQAKLASDSKFEAAQKARQDIEAQLGNLKAALETASRNTDLKVAESKNLSAQVQDLMRALEEQRKVAEKAQEGMARKEAEVVRLAAVNTLSSELKATLTVIKNYISTMLGSQGAISDAQQEFLGVVINKSARLERLINDLVELSEIGSGVKPLRLESVSPSSLVQEALVNARPQAEHKKISLEFAESGNLSAVNVDQDKIEGVIRALLSQAIKVTSRSEKIGLLLSERENSVELRVTDPGMSLPPDRAGKVFAQFHGVDSQAGPEFIGTGLRFPILRSVVEAHGGKIWIESQVGRGKTFVVALPKAGAPALSSPSAAPAGMPTPPPSMPAPGGPAPLAPPPAAVLPSMPAPAGPPKIAPLGPPPAAPVEAPKPAAAPFIPKPAPIDEAAAAPWKRQEPKLGDMDETMELPPIAPKAVAPLPGLPPLGAPSAPAPMAAGLGLPPLGPPPGAAPSPLAPVQLKTDAKPSEADTADFDKVFGGAPAQASEQKGGVPKVELKTGAKPNDADMAQFAALFGAPGSAPAAAPAGLGAPSAPPSGLPTPPPPPPGLGAPKAPNTADFDALFGSPAGPPKSPPPPPPPGMGLPSSPPMGMGGGSPPSPPPGMGAPKPPSSADFDAIFGAAPAAAPTASPPPPPPMGAGPASVPPPGPSTPKPLNLNTLDDLSNMLGS